MTFYNKLKKHSKDHKTLIGTSTEEKGVSQRTSSKDFWPLKRWWESKIKEHPIRLVESKNL